MREIEEFFCLVNAGLGTLPKERVALESFDLKKLYLLTSEQGLQAIAWDGLIALAREYNLNVDELLTREVKLRWALSTEQIEKKYEAQRSVLAELCEFYASYGIKTMLLKGYGLSLLYPKPNHRPCGDIDIWLYGQRARADKLLSKEKGIKIQYDHEHHTIFHYKGIMVENHYDFMNRQSHLSNRTINKYLLEFAQEEQKAIEIGKESFYLPPSNMNTLFLLRHAASHFAAVGIKIRHLIDWAFFVKEEHSSIDWDAIVAICKSQNMHRFFYSICSICVDYLHFDASIFPPLERDKELEDKVLDDILYSQWFKNRPKGFMAYNIYRLRRWWANRWKMKIVYRENLVLTFFTQVRGHFLKPNSFLIK